MQTLDFYFPFIVFGYGLVMVVVTHNSYIEKLAAERMDPALVEWLWSHRLIGQICFYVGFLWTLQRLLLG